MAKFYLVGGAVRDELLGIKAKDLDFAVEAESFDAMKLAVMQRGGKIFLETPEFFTIRANVPKLGVADYVLCRKDRGSADGRHPNSVEVGTLMDDLSRRDFTINAMAKGENGVLIDPFNGVQDLATHTLRTVGRARERFNEDYLRILRAVRFAITKDMNLHDDIVECLYDPDMMSGLFVISKERIREELTKCFAFNTPLTLIFMREFPLLVDYAFSGGLWLKPTLEKA